MAARHSSAVSHSEMAVQKAQMSTRSAKKTREKWKTKVDSLRARRTHASHTRIEHNELLTMKIRVFPVISSLQTEAHEAHYNRRFRIFLLSFLQIFTYFACDGTWLVRRQRNAKFSEFHSSIINVNKLFCHYLGRFNFECFPYERTRIFHLFRARNASSRLIIAHN